MYSPNAGAVETSTAEARNSSTRRRLRRTRSESVLIDMPGSTLREQAGTRVRAPSSSTTQTRQTFTGVRLSRKQSVGVSIPTFLAASRMVEPSVTETGFPSILTSTMRRELVSGAVGIGPRGMGVKGVGACAEPVATGGGATADGLFMEIDSIGEELIRERWMQFDQGRKWRRRAWPAPSLAAS